MTDTSDVVIRVDGLWKQYGVPLAHRLRRLAGQWSGAEVKQAAATPWSLRDISFDVHRGESLGIVGRNGAGKSTLLKVLAGVTPPSRGSVVVAGRVFPMIELNAGLHPDLSGRENAHLLGAVMGLVPGEIEALMPGIESFCEIGAWFDRPVRKYSSGMVARLGFAVAMNVRPDIVLVDEVLAVGDFAFQRKCINRMSHLSSNGVTLVFVSHNPYLLERMCDRVFMLDDGSIEELGQPADVIHRYFEMGSVGVDALPEISENRPGTGELRIQRVEILSHDGRPVDELATGAPATFRLHYEVADSLSEPIFSLRVYDPQNTMVLAFDSTLDRRGARLESKGYVDCRVESLPLMPNHYTVQLKITCSVLCDFVENAARFKIVSSPEVLVRSGNKGVAYANSHWKYS